MLGVSDDAAGDIVAAIGDGGVSDIDRRDNVAGALEVGAALVGQHDPARCTGEQAHAQARLQRGQHPRHRRRRGREGSSRARQRSLVGDRDEGLDRLELVHRWIVSEIGRVLCAATSLLRVC